ncbi:ATP-binding cassette domain-containing protein [Streptomyces sp. L2]|uniref:ATP-binding cassette domain-containing protein n=1 Tax=Streptomyces sp. L2 TaxID=2162665 RepID=UPI001F5077BD|nr:ATP-binding cassette domain-containing protein [Streptomyces sp. L2]
MSSIRVTGLCVRHRKTLALDSVDLDLGTGVHGLLGTNGAGKTSLIRVLATVARPSGGRVEILGQDSAEHGGRTGIRRRLGYLPQEFGYYPGFTVREFVAYVAWLKELPAARAPEAVERAVARVGLGDRIDAKVKTLSGGMVRRVGTARRPSELAARVRVRERRVPGLLGGARARGHRVGVADAAGVPTGCLGGGVGGVRRGGRAVRRMRGACRRAPWMTGPLGRLVLSGRRVLLSGRRRRRRRRCPG